MKVSPYKRIIEEITGPILEHIDELPPELFFFLEQKEKTGIFMHHGMSDKGYHKTDRLKGINHLLYPGPLWKEVLVNRGIPAERIHIVGCPRLDPAFQGKIKYIPSDKKRVAWLPTHNAIPEISSYPAFENCLEWLPAEYEITGGLHPSRRNDPGQTSMEVLFNADVVLSDTSSMLLEALSLGNPVILLDWLVRDGVEKLLHGTIEALIYQEGICYHAPSLIELPGLIKVALDQGIDDKTQNFIDRIFPPELRGKSGKATADALREIADRGV